MQTKMRYFKKLPHLNISEANLLVSTDKIIIIIIKDIYIAEVCKSHKVAMSAEMAVWLRNCLCLYSYLVVIQQ